MYKNSLGLTLAVLAILVFAFGSTAQAGEIIFADDIKQNVITTEVLVRAADNIIVLVDSSSSMGEKDKAAEKARRLQPFQVNSKLVSAAKKDALVMHCLPAERGREITDAVMDGPQAVVFDQAENRLHAQKALLLKLLMPT